MKQLRLLALSVILLAALACRAVPGLSSVEPATQPVFTQQPAMKIVAAPATALPAPSHTPVSATPTTPPTATIFSPTATLALPAATTQPTVTIQVTPSAMQLATFEEIWKTVKENYLYHDFNGLDWNAVGNEYRAKVQAGMSDDDFYIAMQKMIASLGDDHSSFLSPAEVQQSDKEYAGQNGFVGIGVLTAPLPEKKKVTVLLVFPGSPAEAAGIKPHDSLLAADGQTLIDDQGVRVKLLRGLPGTQVNVTVQSPGEQPRTIPIVRQQVSGSMPVPYSVLTTPKGKRVGYIYLQTFMDRTIGSEFESALQAMTADGPLDGLVIDDRFNGGGSTEVASQVFSTLVNGKLGDFVWRGQASPLNVDGRDINGSQKVPLVVLVGEGSASYGEVFPGVLQDLGRAYIIGKVTDGNVEVLSQFNFSDGSRAWIATQTFRPLNQPQVNWEKTGIVPDQVVPYAWDETSLQTDPNVTAALAHFDTLQP